MYTIPEPMTRFLQFSYNSVIEFEKHIYEKISTLDNVEFHNLRAMTNITTDLDNYADSVHYHPGINKLMLENISKKTYLLNEKNYLESFEKLKTEVANYFNTEFLNVIDRYNSQK